MAEKRSPSDSAIFEAWLEREFAQAIGGEHIIE